MSVKRGGQIVVQILFSLMTLSSFSIAQSNVCADVFSYEEPAFLKDGRPNFSQFTIVRDFAVQNKIDPGQLATPVLIKKSKQQRIKRYWNTPVDGQFFYGLALDEKTMKEGEEAGKHPTDLYTVEMFKDFKRMYRYVDQIPNGRFELSKAHILEAHRRGSASLKSFFFKPENSEQVELNTI